MTINIQFTKNFAASYTEEERKINKEVIYKVIYGFENELKVLKKQNLLIYFGWKAKIILGKFRTESLGFFAANKTPGIKRLVEEKNDIEDFESFDYIIYLSKDIGKDENEIFKSFTIAHELQHILQYIYLKTHYLRHYVLVRYFEIKRFNTNELPIEHDAIRKSKEITYKILDKENVDSFINKKIMISRKGEKKYWEKIKNININENIDLEKEMQAVWDKYKNDIEEKIKIDHGLRKAYKLYIKQKDRDWVLRS